MDAAGTLFIADGHNHRVQRLDAGNGVLTTVAGTGLFGYSGDGGPGVRAMLTQPSGLAIDAAGNLLITDTHNNRVRKVDRGTGVMSTIAGGPAEGFGGDGGPARAAIFGLPTGLALDSSGNLFIGDGFNNRVRRVDAQTGTVLTVAGNGAAMWSGDGGPATSANFWFPFGLALDAANLYIADQFNMYIADQFNNRVRRVDLQTGVITTLAGTGGLGGFSGDGGPSDNAALSWPHALALDAAGNLFLTDIGNNRVRRIDARTGIITTVAGDGTRGFGGDGGPATSASLNFPNGLALDATGNLFIADQQNQRVRRVDANTGIISTVAGSGSRGLDPDGQGRPATEANFSYPHGLALDASGNLFIADEGGCRVRRVDARTGMITTVAGIGSRGFGGDRGPATSAVLSGPTALAFDADGNLLIADMDNNRIRRLDARTGIITTITGDGNSGFSGDGGPAARASLHEPYGLAVGATGSIYVSDTFNSRVRKLTPWTETERKPCRHCGPANRP